MQYGLPDPAKISPSRSEADDDGATVDPGHALALVAEMVGERKRVLDLGCGDGRLARLLLQRECDTVGVDINPAAVEEARKYCTHAIVADIDGASLPELLGNRDFDVITLGSVLQRLRQPTRLLDSLRGLLRDGGLVVAVAPNVAHGAIRLALLGGQFDGGEGAGLRMFTAKTIDELFLSAGYRIETLARTKAPIFDGSSLVPHLQRDDFEPAVIAEVELDPEAETLQFVVRAVSLSNEAKDRAISKRFLAVNTELAANRTRLAKRDREVERLTQLVNERTSDTQVAGLTGQVGALRKETAAAKDLAEQHRAHAAVLRAERDQIMGEAASLRAAIAKHDADVVGLKDAIEQHRAHGAALRAERDKEMVDSAALRAALDGERAGVVTLNQQYEQAMARIVNLQTIVDENATTIAMLYDDRDRVAGQIAALRNDLVTRMADIRDGAELLEVADAEIARLLGETDLYAGLLMIADSDAKTAAAKHGSDTMLADQLYDEIRSLYEMRSSAYAEATEDRAALKSEAEALLAQIEELEEETQSLRLRIVSRARANTLFETEAREQLAELERERDAEREARIAGDDLHDTLRVALTVAREELETTSSRIERLEAECEAQSAARLVTEEQHASLGGALIDARHQVNDLKDRYGASQSRLAEQTQALLDQTRAEAERIAVLINTVETSVFWKIKRVVGRMLGR